MGLLIVGASARAAAFSALRIGLRPTCIDLFADADLASTCTVHQVDPGRYPEGLTTIAAGLEPMNWLYTGALENRPDVIDQISTRHVLLGNRGAGLEAVRDPVALSGVVLDAGLASPGVRLDPSGLPLDGSWLRKPLSSAGGRGLAPWIGQSPTPRPSYYQERIEGLPLSALFVGDAGRARCLGITRQFVGTRANRFAYRGNLAPWPVEADVRGKIERLGMAIGAAFGLSGLFGIDLILKDGHPWPIEVNPRYTASVEVLEWGLGRSLLSEHIEVFGEASDSRNRWSYPETYAAKAIVFADRAFRWPSHWNITSIDPALFPEIADIPRPGTAFRVGEPVLTVFAKGDTLEACRVGLASRLREWRRRLCSQPSVAGPSESDD